MATEILKKQTIVGTDAQYEANRNSYEEGTVFESTSLLGETDIDPTYTNKFVKKITSNSYLAYITGPSGDSSMPVYYSSAQPWSIVERDGSGCVRTADPEGQNDAVNKSYADNRFRYTHFIEVKYNAAPEPYEAYVLNGIITYVSESSTPLTSIDDLPLDVTLPIHGKMYLESLEETYTATRKTRSDGSTYLYVTYLMYTDSSGIATGYQNFEPTSFTDTVV